MKQSKAVKAYKALTNLANVQMPMPTTYALYKLRKALEPQWEFQAEQEMAIVDSLGATVGPDGIVTFQKHEDRLEFGRKLLELADTDVDVSFERVRIDLSTRNATLSLNDLEALEDFVEVK